MNKKIAFTICSNNYLAQAFTLADSVYKTNPDYSLIIFICDKYVEETRKYYNGEIVVVEQLGFSHFLGATEKYNVIELNTYIKPFIFEYLFEKYDPSHIIYLDPDITVFNSFISLENLLQEYDVLLTPHILKPIDNDDLLPTEKLFLKYGIYNLGFLALKNCKNSISLIKWWENKTQYLCYIQPSKGIFVDQLWLNHAPVFFDNVHIVKYPGWNLGPWNYHERELTGEKTLIINDNLLFIHFSDFNFDNIFITKKGYNRYNIESNPFLKKYYIDYKNSLVKNGFHFFSSITPFYNKNYLQNIPKKNGLNLLIKKSIKAITPPILIKLFK
jgi:hypothetical protein